MDTLDQGVNGLFQVLVMVGGQKVALLWEVELTAPDPHKGREEQWTPG